MNLFWRCLMEYYKRYFTWVKAWEWKHYYSFGMALWNDVKDIFYLGEGMGIKTLL